MDELKEYAVVYDAPDYGHEDLRFKYVDSLQEAFELYAGACQRAMNRRIKATHIRIIRVDDRKIFADCHVWMPPITHEECHEELRRSI